MELAAELTSNTSSLLAGAAALLVATAGVVLGVRSRPEASAWRRRAPWLCALAVILLIVLAAILRTDANQDLVRELDAALTGAESRRAVADPDAHARRLREHLESKPGDARAWVLYGRLQFELDRFGEAVQAYEKALGLSPKIAKDPGVWCELADALGMVQGGRLDGKPLEHIRHALMIDPDFPKALEMAGSAEYERGRYREAMAYWQQLLPKLEAGSKMHRELSAAIARTERLASGAREKARN